MALTVAGLPTDRFFFEGFLPGQGRRAARAHRRAYRAYRRRWCCSRAGRASPRRSPISRRASAHARPRSAANSPSCTRRCAAARSSTLARDYAAGAETRGEIRDRDRAAGCRRASRAPPRSTRCCAPRSRAPRVKDAVAEVAAATGEPRRAVYSRALELTKDHDARGPDLSARPRRARSGRSHSVRPLGREPRRRLPDRQGLPHRGAALAQPGRRDRHRGAAPRCAGLRRGEGARAARRCGRGRDRTPAAPHHRGGAKPGSRAIRTTSTAISVSTSCWSRRKACRATSRARSTRAPRQAVYS